MIVKYKATIKYRIKDTHPDIKYVKDWHPLKDYESTDIYSFDTDYFEWQDKKERELYMKHDLALVAGGGYTTDHIWNVDYTFERIKEEVTA